MKTKSRPKQLYCMVSEEMKDEIRKKSVSHGVSESEIIRCALINFLEFQ